MVPERNLGQIVEEAKGRRERGDLAGSAALFREAAALAPKNQALRLELARDLRSLGQADEAGRLVDAALEADPANAWAMVEKAHLRRGAGDRIAALALFRRAASAKPENLGITVEAACELIALNRMDEAISTLGEVIQADPAHVRARVEIAQILRRMGDRPGALDNLSQASAAAPANLAVRVELARELAAADREDEARSLIDAVLEADPAHLGGLIERALDLRRRGDRASAAALLEKAAALHPGRTGLMVELARDLAALNQVQRAEGLLRDHLAARPEETGALLALAELIVDQGRPSEAQALVDAAARAARAVAASAMDLRKLGHLHRRLGDRRASRQDFEAAVKADPYSLEAKLDLAAELREAGETHQARSLIQEVLARAPRQLGAWMQLGQLERAFGAFQASQTAFEHAVEVAPTDVNAVVELAYACWAAGEPGRAQSLLDEAMASRPFRPRAFVSGADIALRSGDPDRALRLSLEAADLDPMNFAVRLGAARAAAALFDFDGACRLLDLAEAELGRRAESVLARIQILRQAGDTLAVAALVEEARDAPSLPFGLWREIVWSDIASGDFETAQADLAAAPSGGVLERAHVNGLCALMAEGRRDYRAAVESYQRAIELAPMVPGWRADLARCRLLLAQVDGARASLADFIRLDGAARLASGRSNNPSQHHLGQLLDEFGLDTAVLAELKAIEGRPPEAQLNPLRRLIRSAPDQTAPAVLYLLAQRRAGGFMPPAVESTVGGGIPRSLAQYWDRRPPADVQALMNGWRELNGEFSYALFDDAAAETFIAARHPPEILAAFRRSSHPAQRSDLFRLAWLAAEGGFYVDADDRALSPLRDFVPRGAGFVAYQENYATLANDFIGAAPGHPVILRALELATTAINRGDHDIVWLLSGPGLLTRAFAQIACEDVGLLSSGGCAILELFEVRRAIGLHCALSYKGDRRHWGRAAFAGRDQTETPSEAGRIRLSRSAGPVAGVAQDGSERGR